MAMQIKGDYDRSRIDHAEWVREKQAVARVERAKEDDQGKLPGPQDEYISSERSGKGPTGLYWIGQDENGSRKIFFDDPKKAARAGADDPGESDGRMPKADEKCQEEPEICVADTDAVEREIRKLKDEKQQLEQQIQSASGDEKKIRDLEKKLAQIEQELSTKDNDAYRRQHTVFS